MRKVFVVRLPQEEREQLLALVKAGKSSALKLTRARILLKADQEERGPAWTDAEIAEALEVSLKTVFNVRRKVDPAALGGQVGGTGCRGVDQPRDGAPGAKKNEVKPWLKQHWCLPREQDAEFVWRMEDILDVYQRPYDPRFPVLCMDEASKQLIAEVRRPLPMRPGQPLRIDSEYERRGTCNLFMFCEPLRGWRVVRVTERRTKVDWAYALRDVLTEHYPQAEKIILVMDNLNTHSPASFYEAFDPAQARALTERLEIHYTPKHGSWLNIAECEFSVLSRQCLDRRISEASELGAEVNAWQAARNRTANRIDWQFTTTDARRKLRRLYPAFLRQDAHQEPLHPTTVFN